MSDKVTRLNNTCRWNSHVAQLTRQQHYIQDGLDLTTNKGGLSPDIDQSIALPQLEEATVSSWIRPCVRALAGARRSPAIAIL